MFNGSRNAYLSYQGPPSPVDIRLGDDTIVRVTQHGVVAKRMSANGSESKAKDSVCLSTKREMEKMRNCLSATNLIPSA